MVLVRRERAIRWETLRLQRSLTNPAALQHVHGLNYRLFMVESARRSLMKKLVSGSLWDSFETMAAGGNSLNSLYYNASGLLDNIAWTVALEHGLVLVRGMAVDENSPEYQRKVFLFSKLLIKLARQKNVDLTPVYSKHSRWYLDSIKPFRDAGAHRMPIVITSIVTNSVDVPKHIPLVLHPDKRYQILGIEGMVRKDWGRLLKVAREALAIIP